MLLGYTLTDGQLMEVAEKSEFLDVDDRYIGEEFARRCRNVIPNAEELKDKEWVFSHSNPEVRGAQYPEPCQTSKMELFANINNAFSCYIFLQTLHLRCSTGF